MWVCRNCKGANDNKLNYCSTCMIPKDITEHEGIRKITFSVYQIQTLKLLDIISIIQYQNKIFKITTSTTNQLLYKQKKTLFSLMSGSSKC